MSNVNVKVLGYGPICEQCKVATTLVEVVEDSPPDMYAGDKGYYCQETSHNWDDKEG